MRRTLVITVMVLLGAGVLAAGGSSGGERPSVTVYFSPDGGCTEAIVARLKSARHQVDVQAYNFTSSAIAKALVDAQKRGVKIRAVLDKSNRTAKYSSATFLLNEGLPTFIDAKHAIAHNKVMLIDGRTIITGSFNFTKAAEEDNAENLLIIDDDPRLFAAYRQNFDEHLAHSTAYERPKENDDGR